MEDCMCVDFTPLKAAKVTQGELASLLRVTRVAVNSWIHGTLNIHEMRKPMVVKYLNAIKEATDAGDLPISPDVQRDKRLAAIKKVLVPYLLHD